MAKEKGKILIHPYSGEEQFFDSERLTRLRNIENKLKLKPESRWIDKEETETKEEEKEKKRGVSKRRTNKSTTKGANRQPNEDCGCNKT